MTASGKDIWSRLLGSRSRRRASVQTEAAKARDGRRQRRLERMAVHGLPLWSEAPEHCDCCYRELLPGERPVLLTSGEDLTLACPLCAPSLRDRGYRVLASDTDGLRGLRLSSRR